MSFPAYPDYKHSGVELLAEYPGHWTLKRFKNVFEERAERSSDGSEELLSVSAYFGVKPRSETLDEGDHLSRAESLEGYKVCKAGDLVINIMLAWNRGLGFSWQHGIVSPAYSVFHVTDGSYPKFLDYLVRSDECIRYFKTHSAGIMDSRLRLYPESFGRLFSAIPPACEQTQIARFLDHETARIDALIEEQQRLIELLKEKRQAVISHAVTKGLDPAVPMKDSGVEWLGEVPAHWEQIRIKHVLSAMIDAEHKTAEYSDDGEYLVCRTTNVRDGRLSLEGAKYADEKTFIDWTRRGMPEPLDILFTREAPAGEACVVPEVPKLCLGQRMVLFKLDKSRIDPEFTVHSIYAGLASDFVRQLSQGSTVSHFNMADIGNIPLFEPPLYEQKEISDFLKRRCDTYDTLIQEAELSVRIISERRSALISAAVTGKIDVRGWQPPASTQAPELAVAETN